MEASLGKTLITMRKLEMKHVSKQKLIKIDDFNVDKEKEVKERVER